MNVREATPADEQTLLEFARALVEENWDRPWPHPEVTPQLFEGKLVLTPGEHERDVLAGACAVALKRASLFGRAPVVHDLTVALTASGVCSAVHRVSGPVHGARSVDPPRLL